MSGLSDQIRLSSGAIKRSPGTAFFVIGACVVAAIVAWIVFGLGTVALFAFLVCLVIYFGSIDTLAGAIIVGSLLKVTAPTLSKFLLIWFSGPHGVVFLSALKSTGYIELITLVFLVAFSIRFIIGSFKLVRVNTTIHNNFPKTMDEDDE